MIILGINAFHADAAACVVRDGQLVAAVEEERLRRTKHWAGMPSEAVRWGLRETGLSLGDVTHVALNQDSRANLLRKLSYVVTRRPDVSLMLDRLRNKREREGVDIALARALGQPFKAAVHFVEHHLAHLASAFLVSPFERAAAVSVDGFGDFASAAWGLGEATKIEPEDKIYFPHSLGIFYQALTQYLGYPRYGDEYKVMGLAPYGKPTFLPEMQRIVRIRKDGGFELDLRFFRHARERVDYEWASGEPTVGTIYTPALVDLLGPVRLPNEELTQRHKDLAASVQAMYEEAFFALLNAIHRHYAVDDLALAGGCAMNSVANGKIYAHTPFKRLYVHPAAGDAGGAVGAALALWSQLEGSRPRPAMTHAALGPAYDDEEIRAVLGAGKSEIGAGDAEYMFEGDDETLCARTAQAIADGAVVGWFQGRMEWGPRALGNRSIVCDPRRTDMKDILNRKIKRRESFRPFAPSILRSAVAEWFEIDDDVPFMTQVYPIRAEKRGLIPAVTHVDGSGRLQTVTKEANPLFYRLIDAFRELTGVPLVLNTSFNENEPIVCTPQEALECFLRTHMDMLVMGHWVITRRGSAYTSLQRTAASA
jgi:carbamoyltransferase